MQVRLADRMINAVNPALENAEIVLGALFVETVRPSSLYAYS
jgi:hypothetical protein